MRTINAPIAEMHKTHSADVITAASGTSAMSKCPKLDGLSMVLYFQVVEAHDMWYRESTKPEEYGRSKSEICGTRKEPHRRTTQRNLRLCRIVGKGAHCVSCVEESGSEG